MNASLKWHSAKTVLLGATLAAALALGACGGGSAGGSTGTGTPAATDTATVALAASSYTIAAGPSTVVVTANITRTGTGSGAVSVRYDTVNGDALSGTDFQAASGTLSWAAGDSASKTFPITVLSGATAGRSFTVQLDSASGASLAQPTAAYVKLAAGTGSGGGAGTATLSLASSAYGVAAGATTAQVAVRLARSGTGTGAVSVQFATVNGTAMSGTDYTATSGSLSWAAGDSTGKTVAITLLRGATAGRSFSLQLGSATGATLAQPSSAMVSLVAPGAGLKIISRGVPAFASSGTASQGNDSSYGHTWRSSGVPATLAYDLSAASPAPSAVLLAWYNENSYSYDHALVGQVGYNNAGSYTIEVNAAAGGGSVPTSGWQVVATVTGNTRHSRQHYLQFTGFHWIRINATAADGSAGNMAINIKMDVYDASNGVGDGWFFGGDSITANCMGHGSQGGGAYDSFGNEVAASKGIVPPQENAGMGGWDAQSYGQHLAAWLADTSSKYVTLNLGTNDAAGGVAPATFYARMETLVKAVIAAGKVPVVPTIPWSPEPTHSANTPGLNGQIRALYASYPQVIPGPDVYTLFQTYPNYISSDNIHPTAAGCAALRSTWAQFAASTIY